MQTLVTYLCLLYMGLFMNAQSNTVAVTISDFNSDDGKAFIALYNSENTFLSEIYRGTIVAIKNKTVIVQFNEVPDGEYAISAFHDEDDNGTLNMRMGLWPTEDTATSNNAPALFGPPKWDDAKFEVKGGIRIQQTISM